MDESIDRGMSHTLLLRTQTIAFDGFPSQKLLVGVVTFLCSTEISRENFIRIHSQLSFFDASSWQNQYYPGKINPPL